MNFAIWDWRICFAGFHLNKKLPSTNHVQILVLYCVSKLIGMVLLLESNLMCIRIIESIYISIETKIFRKYIACTPREILFHECVVLFCVHYILAKNICWNIWILRQNVLICSYDMAIYGYMWIYSKITQHHISNLHNSTPYHTHTHTQGSLDIGCELIIMPATGHVQQW